MSETNHSTVAVSADHGHHHADHAKLYLAVLVALLFLTAITVGASYLDFGAANIIIAVLIATTKATLVGLFFMHLLYDKPMNAMILVGAFGFLGLLLTFSLLDIDNRVPSPPSGKVNPSVHGLYAPPPPGAPNAAPANPMPESAEPKK
jgi:cytochrome c oxidase subunit IV